LFIIIRLSSDSHNDIGNKRLAKIKRRAYSAAVCIDSVCSVVIQSAADAQQQQQQQPHPNNK
jgi:hypothetical protein